MELTDEEGPRLRAVLDITAEAVLEVRDDGTIAFANRAVAQLFAMDPADAIGRHISDLLPGFFDRAGRGPSTTELGRIIQRSDGTEVLVEIATARHRAGDPVGHTVVVRDMGRHGGADDPLGMFQQLADRIEDVLYVAELPGRTVRYLSRAFEHVFGRSRLELSTLGGHWHAWVREGDRDRVARALARFFHGDPFDEEYRIVRPDGSERLLRERILAHGGEPLIAGIIQDITEERALTEELHHAGRLELIGMLTSGIAHDFNNLLMGVRGCAEMALEQLPPDHPASDFIDELIVATRYAASLTSQLLRFGRKNTEPPALIHLDTHLASFWELASRLAGERVDLQFRLGAGDSTLMAEPGDIEQIIMNLVSNGSDAMPLGGQLQVTTERVRIDGEEEPDAPPLGEYAVVSVRDSGHGVSPDEHDRIFEPFFTTKKRGEGTGLGLYTVSSIVNKLGGHIRVESKLGVGTTFKLYLPIRAKSGRGPARSDN